MSGSNVELPPSLRNEASRLAEEDGVSLSQWVSIAVAQKISSVETAEAFFKRRGQGADLIAFLEVLRNAPDQPADPDRQSADRWPPHPVDREQLKGILGGVDHTGEQRRETARE